MRCEKAEKRKKSGTELHVSRLAILGALMCSLSLALSGCQDSAQTQEEIVIPREDGQGEENVPDSAQGDEDTAQEPGQEGAAAGAIAEQVQVPEHYSWEGGDGKISVKVDAPFVIPQGEGFRNWKVTSRVFTQEDYDRVSDVLLKGAKLWARDEKLMEASHGFTREEIEERIAQLKAREEEYRAQGATGKIIDEDTAKGRTFEEEIAEWEKLLENAPDEISTVDVPSTVSYTESDEYLEKNTIFGTATVDGRDFYVDLDNNLRDDWRWINFAIRSAAANSNFINLIDEEDITSAQLSGEEIKGMAQKAMTAMGLTDFGVAGEEYFSSFSAFDSLPDHKAVVEQVGYGIHFTRVLDGIPVTYTHADGASIEDGVETSWPYEDICLVYTKDGFSSFEWRNPYEVEKESDEYVFLLPWSEIQGIFEEMMVKKYSDFFEGNDEVQVDFVIDEVRLGYMRVMEKGNFTEGKMVPVWDFLGSETLRYPDMEEPYVMEGHYESWLTINALDGTVIDRGFGY